MRPESQPLTLQEAVRAYQMGDSGPGVMRFLQARDPKRVIGEWEADAYVQMDLDDLKGNAEAYGFTVGRTEGSQRALERIRQFLKEDLKERFIIIET